MMRLWVWRWRSTSGFPPPMMHRPVWSSWTRLEEGRGVYVHCMSGVGRAATTAAAYLVSTGLTPDQAWAAIRKVRPFLRPSDDQLAVLTEFHERDGAGNHT